MLTHLTLKKIYRKVFVDNWSIGSILNTPAAPSCSKNRACFNSYLCIKGIIDNYARGTVAAVEISDRKDSNTLYKFRNLISVNRIIIKDYKVSVSI
jgi:hypothetical protein